MAGYFYVDSQGFFKTSSSKELEIDSWILVPNKPPNLSHRWDFDNQLWIEDLSNTAIAAIADESTKAVVAVLEQAATLTQTEMRSSHLVNLNDLNKLEVGNNPAAWDSLDLLYYRSFDPKAKNNGIYTSSRGYLIFPQLTWDKTQASKSSSFIFYLGSDSRYFSFGLGSRERFNFNSNDYKQCEIGLRFKNSYGCYFQHGLVSTDQGTKQSGVTSQQPYRNLGSNNYYRLDIPNNGDRGESANLYLLPDGDPQNWLGGELIDIYPLAFPPDRRGINLFPVVGDYLGSKHQLLGVLTR